MYISLRIRSQKTVNGVKSLLAEEMALSDPRAYRALTTPDLHSYYLQSTASTPSLRSREAEYTPRDSIRDSIMPDSDGANVKVVVRVRKFIKRGMHTPT